jgi:predicted phosphoribosyltransferase
VVAAEVARALDAPLDVVVVRKLGVPRQPELAMGAIGEGGARVLDADLVAHLGLSAPETAAVEARERQELDRRVGQFRARRPPLDLAGRTVVVVDDGIATGATARAAALVVRALGAVEVVLAVPVAPVGWAEHLDAAAEHYVAVATPSPFGAVGNFYRDFTQTTDAEVIALLQAK